MRKKYKVEFIRYWNNSFGGTETIIASYLSSEIEDVKIDPLKFMDDNFFIRESREASFTLLNDNFIINELMTGIYSEEINVIFYYDEDGNIISADGNNPPDEDEYESKDIILQDLFKIFIKIYETDGNSAVYNNLLFTGVIDTDIQPSKNKVSIKAKDTTWFISQIFDKFNLSAILYDYFSIIPEDYSLLYKNIVIAYIDKIFRNIIKINNITDIAGTTITPYILNRNEILNGNLNEYLPTQGVFSNYMPVPIKLMNQNNEFYINLSNFEFNILTAQPYISEYISTISFIEDLLFTTGELQLNLTEVYNLEYVKRCLITNNNILNSGGTDRVFMNISYSDKIDAIIRYLTYMTISCTVSNYQISINISFKLIKNINGILINDTSLQSTEFQQIEPNTLAMYNWGDLNTELKEILLGQTNDLTYVIDTLIDPDYATTNQIAIELANSNFIFLFIEKLKELEEYMPINYGKYNSSWTTSNQYLIEQEDGSNTITNAKVNISTSHFNQTNDIIDVLYTYEYKNQYNKIIKYLFDNSLTQENISKLNNDANASEMIKLFLFSQAHSLYSETNGILKMIELNSDELPNSRFSNNAVVGDIKLSKNKSDFNSGIDAMDYYWIEPQDEDMSDEDYQSTILDVYTNDVLNPIKVRYNQLFNSNYKFILEVEVFKDRIEYQTGVENLSIGDTVEFDLNIGVYRDIRITGYLIVSKIEETQYTYKLSGIAKKYD